MIIFESHSTSLDNEQRIASGQLDPPLSKKGEQQAKELGIRYKNSKINSIYVSDLMRSFKTAEIAFFSRNIPIIKDARLREWNYGDFNGYPEAEIKKLKILHIKKPFPNGESLLDAVARILGVLKKPTNEQILIIGHRSCYYTLEHLFNKIPLEDLIIADWCWQPGWRYKKLDENNL